MALSLKEIEVRLKEIDPTNPLNLKSQPHQELVLQAAPQLSLLDASLLRGLNHELLLELGKQANQISAQAPIDKLPLFIKKLLLCDHGSKDLTLRLANQEHRIHRLVFAQACKEFRKVLNTHDSSDLELAKNLDSKTIIAFVDFLYLETCNLESSDLNALLTFHKFLQSFISPSENCSLRRLINLVLQQIYVKLSTKQAFEFIKSTEASEQKIGHHFLFKSFKLKSESRPSCFYFQNPSFEQLTEFLASAPENILAKCNSLYIEEKYHSQKENLKSLPDLKSLKNLKSIELINLESLGSLDFLCDVNINHLTLAQASQAKIPEKLSKPLAVEYLDLSASRLIDLEALLAFCPALKNLNISKLKVSNFAFLKQLSCLETLVANYLTGLISLDFSPNMCSCLRFLSINYATQLKEFENFSQLYNLEELSLAYSCLHLLSLDFLKELKKLKSLSLIGLGRQVNLEPLFSHKSLQKVNIKGYPLSQGQIMQGQETFSEFVY